MNALPLVTLMNILAEKSCILNGHSKILRRKFGIQNVIVLISISDIENTYIRFCLVEHTIILAGRGHLICHNTSGAKNTKSRRTVFRNGKCMVIHRVISIVFVPHYNWNVMITDFLCFEITKEIVGRSIHGGEGHRAIIRKQVLENCHTVVWRNREIEGIPQPNHERVPILQGSQSG